MGELPLGSRLVSFINLGILTMTSHRPLLALNILFPKQVTGFPTQVYVFVDYYLRSDQLHLENFWGGCRSENNRGALYPSSQCDPGVLLIILMIQVIQVY